MAQHTGLKPFLPVAYSSDWHQILAKALFARMVKAGLIDRSRVLAGVPAGGILLTRDELDAAAAAEYGYDLSPGGGLIFCPLSDSDTSG